MKLYSAFRIGLCALLVLGGCRGHVRPGHISENTSLSGVVTGETYIPASIGVEGNMDMRSRYSFEVSTGPDKRRVIVYGTNDIPLERVNDLIDVGTEVNVEVGKLRTDDKPYHVFADKVKIGG